MPLTTTAPSTIMPESWRDMDMANPTEEHSMLREMVRNFVRDRVEPQALENDREERFNIGLFREMGSMGLLGLTVPPEYGGAGMDATSVAIVNEELSYSDPGLCLAFLAHDQLFVNNLVHQRNRFSEGPYPPQGLQRRVGWLSGYERTRLWYRCIGNADKRHNQGRRIMGDKR